MKCITKNLMFKFILLVTSYSLLVTTIGCDSLSRKFIRKSKNDQEEQVEMVLAPEEYKGANMTKEEQYRQYFLFWKSWHDELITSLDSGTNYKKRIECINQAIDNLGNLRQLLNTQKQKDLDVYIGQLNSLKDKIKNDIYGSNLVTNRQGAERIKRNLLRDFSYPKVKNELI